AGGMGRAGSARALASSGWSSVKAGGAARAKPPITSRLVSLRTLRALALTMVCPIETCPSPPIATVPPLRTVRIVVACQESGELAGFCIGWDRVVALIYVLPPALANRGP